MSFYPSPNSTLQTPVDEKLPQNLIELPDSDDPAHMIDSNFIRQKKRNWLQWLINKRTEERRNTVIMVLGQTRAGKSWSSLTLARLIDQNKDFDESHVIFKVSEFIEKINSCKEKCCIVFDEGGAELNARQFQSQRNIMMNAILQTWGSRYLSLIMNLPGMTLTDKVARQLTTFSLRMRDRGWADVYSHWYSVLDGQLFTRNVGIVEVESPLTSFNLPKKHRVFPPHDFNDPFAPCYKQKEHIKDKCYTFYNSVVHGYEVKKYEYQQNVYNQYLEKIKDIEGSPVEKSDKEINIKSIVGNIVSNPDKYILDNKLNTSLISVHHNISYQAVNRSVALLRKAYPSLKSDLDNFKEITIKNKPLEID